MDERSDNPTPSPVHNRGPAVTGLALSSAAGVEKRGATYNLALAPTAATIRRVMQLWGRAQRRQRMVRDLEDFLAIQVGGWPRKSDRMSSDRRSAEANHAFATN